MSNVKHKNCIVRQLAKIAKSRLCKNDYEQEVAPTGATPEQKEIYLKLCKLQKDGETVTNPVASFADPEKLKTLSHEEKQRYILSLCADYVSVKKYLDGITCWNTLIQDFAVFKAYFDDPVTGILTILPMIVFTLAGINFIVALVSACGKKYGRAYNLIMSIVLAACAVVILFRPFIAVKDAWEGSILAYFKDLVDSGYYMLIASAALGVLQLIFGLCFCKSLKRKEKKVK